MNLRILFFCLLAFCSCTSSKSDDDTIYVFCASSLAPVIEDIKLDWEKENSESIVISTASSGTLAKQIENGAHADIYLSANHIWSNYLISNLKLKSPSRNIGSNRLVLISPRGEQSQVDNIQAFIRIYNETNASVAIANPDHVPLGKYTEEVFLQQGISLRNSDQIVLTKDARSVLRLVELGEAEFGIVYQSDARSTDKVTDHFIIPQSLHSKITYQAIAIGNSRKTDKFLNYILSPERRFFWANNGFPE